MVVSTVDLACQSHSRRFAHKQNTRDAGRLIKDLRANTKTAATIARSTVYLTDEVATILITHQNE
jgi:hypothetical protein